MQRLWAVTVLLGASIGCVKGGESPPVDTSSGSTAAPADTAAPTDTSPGTDTTPGTDTAPGSYDSALPDTSRPPDTAAPDTAGPRDTGPSYAIVTTADATWSYDVVFDHNIEISDQVAEIPDLDGDGLADLAWYDEPASDGISAVESEIGLLRSTAVAPGASPSAEIYIDDDSTFIRGFAAPGDLDGDGAGDLLVLTTAEIYVFSGSTLAKDGTYGSSSAASMIDDDHWALTALGDVDGDGLNEVEAWANGTGRLLYGDQLTTVTSTKDARTSFDYHFLALGSGDVDGDGLADVLFGECGATDQACLFTADALSATLTATDASATWTAASAADEPWFGREGAVVGDIDGDGRADIALADSHWSGVADMAGHVDFVLTSLSGLTSSTSDALPLKLQSSRSTDAFGFALSDRGDLDADGNAETSISGLQTDVGEVITGRICTYEGATLALGGTQDAMTALSCVEQAPGDDTEIGDGLDAHADVTGDGLSDLLFMGASGSKSSPDGAMYLLAGP